MLYPLLSLLFFFILATSLAIAIAAILRPQFWVKSKPKILQVYLPILISYIVFILFFCGPKNLEHYPAQDQSAYMLPWEGGVSRFVAQGNRSFVSHRALHHYAWDFVMPNGSKVLAARSGTVTEVEDGLDGIGIQSNYIIIEHQDGFSSSYVHIRHDSALVEEGDRVIQGDAIALSGMVGQTIFPHLHFYVLNKDKTASVPISFIEVDGGVPLAGRSYSSGNWRE